MEKDPRQQNTTFPPSSPGFLIIFLRAYLKRFAVDSTSSFSSKTNPAARKQHRQNPCYNPNPSTWKKKQQKVFVHTFEGHNNFWASFLHVFGAECNIFFAYTLSVKQLAPEKMRASRRRSGFLFGATFGLIFRGVLLLVSGWIRVVFSTKKPRGKSSRSGTSTWRKAKFQKSSDRGAWLVDF